MPGNAGGGGYNPYRLTIVELLLQGYPGEFLPIWAENQRHAEARHGVSDRALMLEAAAAWVTSTILRDEEKARIHAVWLDDVYQPPHNLDTARRDELRGMMHRSVA